MENTGSESRVELKSMGHRLEMPQPMIAGLREAAEKVGLSRDTKDRIENTASFMVLVTKAMQHFQIEYSSVKPVKETALIVKGGFNKRAIQKHPYLGVNGLRLVRDKESKIFLKEGYDQLYSELLDKKLFEAAKELTEAMGRNRRLEKLADVYEVAEVSTLTHGIEWTAVELRMEKIKQADRRKTQRRKRV